MSAIKSAKDVETVKRFLSCDLDVYRNPFARRSVRSPRAMIFGGTANPSDLLNDPTGARRFWIVVSDRVNVELLREQRDQIWAQAKALHLAGEQHWLTDEEGALLVEAQRPHTACDPWEEDVLRFAAGEASVSVRDVLKECLSFATKDIEQREQNRVAAILRKAGWTSYRSGGYARWRAPNQLPL